MLPRIAAKLVLSGLLGEAMHSRCARTFGHLAFRWSLPPQIDVTKNLYALLSDLTKPSSLLLAQMLLRY